MLDVTGKADSAVVAYTRKFIRCTMYRNNVNFIWNELIPVLKVFSQYIIHDNLICEYTCVANTFNSS